MSGILALQSDVARKVASALALKLLPAEKARLAGARTVNPEAYEAYLKGSQYWIKMTKGGVDAAQGYFDMALQKESDFAKAWAGLAWVWAVRNQMGYTPPSVAVPKQREAALKAVALDDTLATAHYALAGCKTWGELDPPAAGPEWQRAVQLDPNDPNGLAMYSHYLAIVGHMDEAMTQIDRAVSLDPFNVTIHSFRAFDLVVARRYDEAIAEARKALALEPGNPTALGALMMALHATNRHDEMIAAAKETYAGWYPDVGEALERGYAGRDYAAAWRRAAEFEAAKHSDDPGAAYDVAQCVLYAGDTARALDWLEKAYEMRDPNMPYLGVLPIYDPLRSDPRFQALLRKMGLPTTQQPGTQLPAGASS
jgi:adenylate cyclase